jgi:hypothetical protein
MKLPRRQFLQLTAGAAALPATARIARAQAYPSRPVRIIVGAAPSGTYDIMARLIGEWLSERLGQPFVIENRPGAGTTIGTEAVVKAPQMVIRSCLSAQRPQPARCSMTNSISISSGTSRLSRPSAASPTLWW